MELRPWRGRPADMWATCPYRSVLRSFDCLDGLRRISVELKLLLLSENFSDDVFDGHFADAEIGDG
jgi:hypothetical protein